MKTVLITGGSSGIGYEVSRHFARDGYRLLWVSKPPKELQAAAQRIREEIPQVALQTLALDLSDPAAARKVYGWVQQNDWPVDVLINNAGFGTHGLTHTLDLQQEVDMINLNVVCLYQLTRLFLDDMIQKDQGTIINISSNSSFQPVARMNTYASTKAFVKHFSRGLQEELVLMKSKVKVITVCPSAVIDSPFKNAGGMENVKTFQGIAYTTVEEVGKDIWNGFRKGKTFVVTGMKMRFLHFIAPLIPYALQQYLVRKETERKG